MQLEMGLWSSEEWLRLNLDIYDSRRCGSRCNEPGTGYKEKGSGVRGRFSREET